MAAYYNENDPFAVAWLRELIKAGQIAPGDVDPRSIEDVRPDDLKGYTQCHFFAGIGGWSYALRRAEWPDNRPVWTGSCPCQPFSSAGKGAKQSDERHLWPHWSRIIAESKPTTIFGEQVASAVASGWADEVSHDMEKQGYAFAAAILPACSVGAPHRRDRYWFVAHAEYRGGGQSMQINAPRQSIFSTIRKEGPPGIRSGCEDVADHDSFGCERITSTARTTRRRQTWDENWWRFEPPVGRVADGVPSRSPKLRGYGNAIVPEVGEVFIEAVIDILNEVDAAATQRTAAPTET